MSAALRDAPVEVQAGSPVPTPSGAPETPNGVTSGPFIVDELVDIGPAGPAAATAHGVVLIDKEARLHVARRGPLPKGDQPATSPFESLDLPREAFAPYARGPAIANGSAYWVGRGWLLRRKVDGSGQTEVLARDARAGTRVAAGPLGTTGALVAYIVTPDDEKIARGKLWVEGGKTYNLTPDGSATSSVALATQRGSFMLLALDGRSGMSPLHARRVVVRGKEVTLGPDTVTWVGASSQGSTEIFAATRGEDVFGLIAIERDVLHFGLAQIRIGPVPRLDAPASFVPFENGINTAPIAANQACGRTLVVYARPGSREPGAPEELWLTELTEQGLAGGALIARSKAFADTSLAGIPGGAVLAYTADYRTWATTIRCRP